LIKQKDEMPRVGLPPKGANALHKVQWKQLSAVRAKLQKALFKGLLSSRVVSAKGKVTGNNTASATTLMAKGGRQVDSKSPSRKRKNVPDALCTPCDQSVDSSVSQPPVPKKQSLRAKRTSQLQAACDAAYDKEPPKWQHAFTKAMLSIEVGDKENISPTVLTSSLDFRIKVMVDTKPGVHVV